MKKIALNILLVFSTSLLFSQTDTCNFTPVINEGDYSLLEGDSCVLTTQEYDSYSWYVSGFGDNNFALVSVSDSLVLASLLPGDNLVFIETTLNGCTAVSDTITITVFFNDCGMGMMPTINGQPYGDVDVALEDTLVLNLDYPTSIFWYQTIDGGEDILLGIGDIVVPLNAEGEFSFYYEFHCGCTLITTGPSFEASVNECNYIPSINEGTVVLCHDDTLMLSSQTYDGYAWYGSALGEPVELLSTDSILVIDVNPGVYSYYLEASINGCTNLSESIAVYVNSNMVLDTEYDGMEVLALSDSLFVVEYWMDNESYGGEYWWYLDGEQLDVGAVSSIMPTETGVYTAMMPGCGGDSDDYFFELTDCDLVPTINEGDLQLTNSDTLMLSTQSYDAYQWFFGPSIDNINIVSTDSIFISQNIDQGVYFVYLIAMQDSCIATSDTIEVTVFFDDCGNVAPPYINTGDIVICAGDSILIDTQTIFPASNIWLLSEDGGTFQEFSYDNNLNAIFDQPGEYDLLYHMTVSDDCIFNSNTIHISVNSVWEPAEDIVIEQIGDQLITLNDPLVDYTWFLDGEMIISENINAIVPTEEGVYSVELTSPCGSVTASYYYTDVSIDDWDLNYRVFPNPTNGSVQIISDQSIQSIEVVNILGEVLDIYLFSSNVYCVLDFSDYSEGQYFLKITSGIGISVEKIIVSKIVK